MVTRHVALHMNCITYCGKGEKSYNYVHNMMRHVTRQKESFLCWNYPRIVCDILANMKKYIWYII